MISSIRARCRSPKTRCRYFVTNTRCACSRNAQCLPGRRPFLSVRDPTVLVCSSGTPTASTRPRVSGSRWRRRSGAPGWCSTTRSPPAGPPARRGEPYPTDAALSKALTAAKRTPARAWLAEVSAVVLQQALADANTAYRNFFASVKGARKGRRLGAPRFRSRRDRAQSIRFTRAARFRVTSAGRLRLPGDRGRAGALVAGAARRGVVGDGHRGRDRPVSRLVRRRRPRGTRSRRPGGRWGSTSGWRTSRCCRTGGRWTTRGSPARRPASCGGLSRNSPADRRARRTGRKAVRKVARCHARVGDTRRDWLHKLSTTLIRENQAVYVEDLAVSGLARTRLARSVADAGWSTFVQMLAYKAARHGRTFVKVDRWLPSTRACSACGAIGEAKPLHVREWTCPCGAVHDRDVNAARNILAAGRADSPTLVELVSAGTPVPQSAVKRGTRREHGMSRADRNPRPSGRGGRQFMAHWDFLADNARVAAMRPGRTGLHPYVDNFVRLSRLPLATIAEIRGRTRGAGSEFVLATDIRFASEAAVLGQFEVGVGAVPGGGPMARLGRLVGRGCRRTSPRRASGEPAVRSGAVGERPSAARRCRDGPGQRDREAATEPDVMGCARDRTHSTSRAESSSHVSRRTTRRAAPSSANTTGMRRAPL